MSPRPNRSRTDAAPPAETDPVSRMLAQPLVARALRWLIPLLVAHSGVMLALASPQHHLPLAWAVMLVPMFLALDLALRLSPAGRWAVTWRVFACTWPAGVVMGGLSGGWVTNTAHVFGGLPKALAYGVAFFGYGSLHGLELFFFLGVPFALTWRRPVLALLFVPLWATVFELLVPRFLFFTYGQAMIATPELVQFADVLGSGGLSLLLVPLQLVLYGWLRSLYAPEELPRRALAGVTAALLVLFAAAWGYGRWRMTALAEPPQAASSVEIVGIQPNFSLAQLASNPALAHSEREQNLAALLSDSARALSRAERPSGAPTVVLWPESVYPRAYFHAPELRRRVEAWVRREQVELILASLDARVRREAGGPARRDVYGISLHVGPQGDAREVYRKIQLIPFGETVPFGDLLPWYRELLQAWIPRISQFARGEEYTTFTLGNGVPVAPMICFDATVSHVALGMARNGARLGLVLANLAWFGRTSVSDQFAWFVRFRAIETRLPFVFLSQNGESYLIDRRGMPASERLGQYEEGALVETVALPRQASVYTHLAPWVRGGYVAALVAVGVWGFARPRRRRGRGGR